MTRGSEYGSLDDAELVGRCRAGDEGAWRELVERFSRYVFAICVQAYRLPEPDAEDVFQDVFARVYERLGQLRSDEAVRPWIAQLTRNCCVDRLRRGARVEPSDGIEEGEADEQLEQLEEAWAVRQLLAELSENCRDILDRFFARDQSYRTIAEELGLPPGTIASRISRCLAQLRERAEGRIDAPASSGGRSR
ncbi:MAG TPA: sigma-70 family RNA polymerase sigma factor [Gaiellaceae bacterium]|nr:sigma-70 family RNA polymerase sigma factor [Gaiellaceae bacterium]